jgi:IS30 family transposase
MLRCGIRQWQGVAEHEIIASELEANIYFAYPYHFRERGLNENSNELLQPDLSQIFHSFLQHQ